ncbi:MAG: outer membrane beta-barrel protein [Tannerellaceae bacterium]|jgi:outer membrane receptor protein involved in Fe transport|nr:outer membrane beta-barrel protein [Tannerellaceae bacterium]
MQISEVELSEVTVLGKQQTAKLNRDIYRISPEIKRSSPDVFLALSSLPVLAVDDFNKTVSLRGASNSVVLVNNIRRTKEYVQLIRPENIERIEVSHSPGARYTVNGVDGIINIITKYPTTGYNGFTNDEISTSSLYTRVEGGFNYVTENMVTSLVGSESLYHDKRRDISLLRDANGVHTDKRNNGRYDATYHIPKLNVNWDYTLSPETFISLNANYSDFPKKTETPYDISRTSSDGQGINLFDALEKEDETNARYNTSLYFQTAFTPQKTLNVDMDYSTSKGRTRYDYHEYNRATGDVSGIHQVRRNKEQSANMQVNFRQEFAKIEWEEGVRFQWEDYQFHHESQTSTTDRQQRTRGYAYLNATGSIGERFVYQSENIFDIANMKGQGETSHTYKGFTPQIMLRYFLGDNQSVMFNYGLSHTYPDFSLLNPTPVYLDSSRITSGNPNLKPFFRQSYRLTYQLTRPNVKNLFIRLAILYQLTNNNITRKEEADADGIYHISYLNAARHYNLQFQINAALNVINNWYLYMEAWGRRLTFKDDYQLQFNKQYWEYFFSMGSQFRYKNFIFMYTYIPTFRTPTLTGFEKTETYSAVSARYRINRSLDVGLSFRDFAAPKTYKREAYTDTYNEIYTNTMTQRRNELYITINWYFQKGIQKQKKQKQTKEYENSIGIDTRNY